MALVDGPTGENDHMICVAYRHQFDLINESTGDAYRLHHVEANRVRNNHLHAYTDIYNKIQSNTIQNLNIYYLTIKQIYCIIFLHCQSVSHTMFKQLMIVCYWRGSLYLPPGELCCCHRCLWRWRGWTSFLLQQFVFIICQNVSHYVYFHKLWSSNAVLLPY